MWTGDIVFKSGDRVFHKWSHPDRRPNKITKKLINSMTFAGIGTIIDIERSPGFKSRDNISYWKVNVGGKIVEWREDLIVWVE